MKLATWNVNSVRARVDRVLAWFDARRPDVACLQEIKCLDGEFPAEAFAKLGYQIATYGQKTYNGVAILSLTPLAEVTRGFGDGGDEAQSRLIAATVRGVRVASVYVPNGQAPGTDKFAYKLDWLARLARWAAPAAGDAAPFALFGDFNVAPAPIDVHDPAVWEGQIHFTMDERNALAAVCAAGLCDVVRELNPDQPLFTWWDYRQLAFPKNKGLRIDHVLANSALRARVKSAVVDRDERKGEKPSDHAPVVIEVAD